MELEGLNLDGIDDKLIRDIKNSVALLCTRGEPVVVTDNKETEQLLAEFAEAGVNLFDSHSAFQNIFILNNTYFIQVKRIKFYRGVKGGPVTVLDSYEYSTIILKKLQNDYGKISIAPLEMQAPFMIKWLSHIFSSDEVIIPGHDLFNSRYGVSATDKTQADYLLTDKLLDLIAEYDDVHLTIANDKMIIWQPGLDEKATKVLLNIMEAITV